MPKICLNVTQMLKLKLVKLDYLITKSCGLGPMVIDREVKGRKEVNILDFTL